MKKLLGIFLTVLVVSATYAYAQEIHIPLRLAQKVELPDLEGRFDHFGVDLQGHRLFVTPEDHKTVEVLDLRTYKRIHSIGGFKRPHWVIYRPDLNEIFVTDGPEGTCKIFRGDSYALIKAVQLSPGADSITYDPANKYLYVAHGGRSAGEDYSKIAIVDTTDGKSLADIRIDARRIEGMAFEQSGKRLFVNMTSNNAVGVADLEKRAVIATWTVTQGEANVPMALDEIHHRLFVVTRTPGRFIVFDTASGKEITSLASDYDADDIAYDAAHRRIYVSCGEGFVDVYRQLDPDHYQSVAKLPTGPRASTSCLVPELNRYFVAAPQHGDRKAEILVYQVGP